ncbi:hypothetical protein JTE90_010040 [Oedothorax gibbosus]|uniref:Uncharacterized protein n=1 Tax=Oedothorax gibbosus TaxID=931172 RepID=A0AAV6V621_9ARAC|nr:hypothetical protein JTE90_010040 [Oedothorax gibbosus]
MSFFTIAESGFDDVLSGKELTLQHSVPSCAVMTEVAVDELAPVTGAWNSGVVASLGPGTTGTNVLGMAGAGP